MREVSKRSGEQKPTSVHFWTRAWKCECGSEGMHFDRSICACSMMHHYCDGCGRQVDECWEDNEVHDACGCEKCHPELHGFAGDPSGL